MLACRDRRQAYAGGGRDIRASHANLPGKARVFHPRNQPPTIHITHPFIGFCTFHASPPKRLYPAAMIFFVELMGRKSGTLTHSPFLNAA